MNKARYNKEGVLSIIATPIGNLEDITLRAIRTLKEVDYILCEDKRVTQKLLNHFEIKTKLISFHKYNEKDESEKVVLLLKSGSCIALVSDAGSPLISDPGSELISRVYKEGIKVISIPGPSAVISALSICPIKFNQFTFIGFLPDKASRRNELISSFSTSNSVIVLYVAPHDFKKYISEIYTHYPDINVFYARELTKIYEESWCGEIKDLVNLLDKKKLKGEIVLVLNFQDTKIKDTETTKEEIIKKMEKAIKDGKSLKETSKHYAKEYNLSSNDLYKVYLKNRSSINRAPM